MAVEKAFRQAQRKEKFRGMWAKCVPFPKGQVECNEGLRSGAVGLQEDTDVGLIMLSVDLDQLNNKTWSTWIGCTKGFASVVND